MTYDIAKVLFENTFSDEKNQDTLRIICNLCGVHETSVCRTSDGAVDSGSTLYNEGRRSVWLDIRRLLPKYVLEYVEVSTGIEEESSDETIM